MSGPAIARIIKGIITSGIDGPTFLNNVDTKIVNEVKEMYTKTATRKVFPIKSGVHLPKPLPDNAPRANPSGSNPPQMVPNNVHNAT